MGRLVERLGVEFEGARVGATVERSNANLMV